MKNTTTTTERERRKRKENRLKSILRQSKRTGRRRRRRNLFFLLGWRGRTKSYSDWRPLKDAGQTPLLYSNFDHQEENDWTGTQEQQLSPSLYLRNLELTRFAYLEIGGLSSTTGLAFLYGPNPSSFLQPFCLISFWIAVNQATFLPNLLSSIDASRRVISIWKKASKKGRFSERSS